MWFPVPQATFLDSKKVPSLEIFYDLLRKYLNRVAGSLTGVQQVGLPIASAARIAPSAAIQHVTGAAVISTIVGPPDFTGPLYLIADGAWSLTTGGNIGLATSAQTPGRVLIVVFDGVLWYPNQT